jgi:hypothetical protein
MTKLVGAVLLFCGVGIGAIGLYAPMQPAFGMTELDVAWLRMGLQTVGILSVALAMVDLLSREG